MSQKFCDSHISKKTRPPRQLSGKNVLNVFSLEYLLSPPYQSLTNKRMPILSIKRIEMLLSTEEVNESEMKCQYCRRKFGLIKSKYYHETKCPLNPINNKGKRYICNNCTFICKRKCDLNSHKRHDCGITHKCEKCYKVFSEKLTFRRHIKRNNCSKKQIEI